MKVRPGHMLCALLVLFAATSAFSQMAEQDVRARLDAVYAGKADQVSRELPALLQQHPRDAGVLYIQAVLTTDGAVAVKRYQDIAENYPQSVWADDALYKVYQYNYSLGLYKRADEAMELLRSRYPQSIYVTGADAKGVKQEKNAAVSMESSSTAAPTAVEKQAEPVKKEAVVEQRPATARVQQTQPSVQKPAAAAQQTQPVVQKPAAATQQTQPLVQRTAAAGKFYVQVGVFSLEANAKKAIEKYGSLVGRLPGMTPKTIGDKTQYIVRFEGFETAESARSFSAELRTKHNIDSFIFPNQKPAAH